MLDARNIRLKVPWRKLSPKSLGPYPVVWKVGQAAYALQLLDDVKFYPVFYDSLLTDYKGPAPNTPKPIEVEGDLEYEFESIINSKFHKRQLK